MRTLLRRRGILALALTAAAGSTGLAACEAPGAGNVYNTPDGGGATADVAPGLDAGQAQDAVPAPDTGGSSPADQVCARWNADRQQRAEGTWTGSTQTCDAGDFLAPGRQNTLTQVNLFRWLAGLPPTVEDASWTADAQRCALMMEANGTIDHSPPASWTCYDPVGADAAGHSNLATTPAVLAVDLYMIDDGTADTLGHRRWILSNTLDRVGVGSTDGYSCLRVIGGSGSGGPDWVAWPPPGVMPAEALDLLPWGSTTLDDTGWSIQSDAIDLSPAAVTVTEDGEPRAVTVKTLSPGYGSASAIAILPQGWRAGAGHRYEVHVAGLEQAIDYAFDVVSCGTP